MSSVKSIIRALSVGLVAGMIVVFFLVLGIGMKMSSSTGTVTQEFLGLAVLEATKVTLESGGSSSSMKPLPGILVPLLGPALVFLMAHLLKGATPAA